MSQPIHQINFKDELQDLLSVKIEIYTEAPNMEGMIVEVSLGCSPVIANMYIGNVVDLKDNPVGANFNYAKPSEGFRVVETKWIVESIKKLEEDGNTEEREVPLPEGLQREDPRAS